MTPTNKRNLMLATSGLAGLAGLASLTLGVNDANAACVIAVSTIVCDGDQADTDQASEINAKIVTVPAGSITLTINGGASAPGGGNGIDLDGTAIKVLAPQFKDAVTFVNNGVIGKQDTGAKTDNFAVANTAAVTIVGDQKAPGNIVSFTNNNEVNGNVLIDDVGGSATVNIATGGQINGTAAGTGGTLTVTDVIGNGVLTTAAGTKVSGAITFNTFAATPIVTKSKVGNVDTSVSTNSGGAATVTIAGDVGHSVAAGVDAKTGLALTNFIPSSVSVRSKDAADFTIAATGKIGATTVQAGDVVTTTTTDLGVVSGAVKTDTTTVNAKGNNAALNFNVATGGIQGGSNGAAANAFLGSAGNLALHTDGGVVTFNNAGAVAQGTNTATTGVTKGLSSVAITTNANGAGFNNFTTTTINKTQTTTIENTVNKTTTTNGAKVDFTNSGTIGVTAAPAPVSIQGIGINATVSGLQGAITLNGAAQTKVDNVTKTFEDVTGKALTVNSLQTETNISKDVNLALTTTTAVVSTGVHVLGTNPSAINTGGNVKVDSVGRIGALVIDATVGNLDQSTETKSTFDKTGPMLTQVQTQVVKDTGGDVILNIFGNISGAGGATPGVLQAFSSGNITADLKGAVIGNTRLETTEDVGKGVQTFAQPLGEPASTTQDIDRSASGGAINVKIASTTTLGDQTGVALTAIADGNIDIVNDGKLRGGLTATSARNLAVNDDNTNVNSVTKTGDTVTIKNVTTLNTTNTTVGGTATVANNSLNSLLGDTNISAVGGVTFTNPGLATGNVTLASQGTSTVVANSTTTTTANTQTAKTGPAPGAFGQIITTDVVTSNSTSVTPNGGNVTGTYAGVTGLDNNVTGLVAGTLITQTADKDSVATVAGKTFVGLTSNAGANATLTTTDTTSTLTTTEVAAADDPSLKLRFTAVSGSGKTVTTNKSTSNGGVSTVTISGSVSNNPNGVTSSVLSTAQGASTVAVSGSVQGNVTAASAAANTFTSTTTETVNSLKAGVAGKSDPAIKTTTTTPTTITTSTAAGGAAKVDITGTATLLVPSVGGNVAANGQTTATANVGAKARVNGNVSATVSGTDTSSKIDKSTTAETTTTSANAAAIGGAANTTTDGPVGGNVSSAAQTGAANTAVRNTVGGNVSATSAFNNSLVTDSVKISTIVAGFPFTSSRTQTSTTTGVGGAAKIDLTAPAVIADAKANTVGGSAIATGGTATLNVGAGSVVAGNTGALANANVTTAVTEAKAFKTNATFTGAAESTRTTTTTTTNNPGAAVLLNNGTLNGGNNSAVGSTATLTNNFVVTNTGTANALFTNSVATNVQTNLDVAINGTNTTTTVFTPLAGTTATIANNGTMRNGSVAGATGAFTNAATASVGNVAFGSSVVNGTLVQGATATTTPDTFTAGATPFGQTYTLTQNGYLGDGISVQGAVITGPVNGTALSTPYAVTSKVVATLNLNSGSLTEGGIVAERERVGSGDGAIGPVLGTSSANTFLTDTTLNLNGTGWLGHDGAVNATTPNKLVIFNAAPTLTQSNAVGTALQPFAPAPLDQLTFHNNVVNNGANHFVDGINTINHTGAGTFYVIGRNHSNANTPTRADDAYTWRFKNFNNTAGRVEFSSASEGGIFSFSGNVNNNAEFVVGNTLQPGHPLNPFTTNAASSLTTTQTVVRGQEMLVTGNFTQATTGTLIVGALPELVRTFSGFSGTAPEVLGLFKFSPGTTPFQLVTSLSKSHVVVEGNLNLAGTVLVNNARGGFIVGDQLDELFTVSGTTTITATVRPAFGSNFINYTFTQAKCATNAALNCVFLNTTRTSFTTKAPNQNAFNVAAALDGSAKGLSAALIADQKGTSTFPTILALTRATDLAGTIVGFDWNIGLNDVPTALNELSQGEFYGTLNAIDPTDTATDALRAEFHRDMNSLWATPTFQTRTYEGDATSGAGEVKSTEAGLLFGGTFNPTDNIGWGFSAGYQGAEVDGQDDLYEAEVNSYLAALSGRWSSGPILIGGVLTYSASNIEARREMTIFARDVYADYDSQSVGLNLTFAYTFPGAVGGGDLTPYIDVGFRNISTDGFEESDSSGGIGLRVAKFSETETTPILGLNWARQGWEAGFATIDPYLGVQVILNDAQSTSTQQFLGGGDAFTVQGVDPDTSFKLLGGFTGSVTEMMTFSVGASASFGAVEGAGFNASLRWGF